MEVDQEIEVGHAPAELSHRRNSEGLYKWNGILHPSVTTCLGIVSKGEILHKWMGKMAALETFRDLELYENDHITLPELFDKIRNWQHVMTAGIRYRDWKGAIGSLMHHRVYEKILGLATPKDETAHLLYHIARMELVRSEEVALELAKAAMPYVTNAFAWFDAEVPDIEVVGLEAMVVSEEHGYAGTMDFKGTLKSYGKRVVDLKSSNRLADTFPMQIEAYRNADFIGLIEDGSQHEIGETEGIAIVHVTGDKGKMPELHTWEANDDVFEGFLCARYLYGLLNNMPKPNAKIRRSKPGADKQVRKRPF